MAEFSVFTKPWSGLCEKDLIETVRGMGFSRIEFPLREGAQVSPAEAEKRLPGFARRLLEAGIAIDDVASTPEERVFAACRACGIPMIRVMFLPPRGDYLAQEAEYLKTVEGWLPLCREYGVKIGLQMHKGRGPVNSDALRRIVGDFDSAWIGGIWDAAHSALAGEDCEQALDTIWDHLLLVNFKNARYRMAGRGARGEAEFEAYFCPGPDGVCPWPRAVDHLKAKGYNGTWCLPAEYTGASAEESAEYARRDLMWLRSLVESHG